MQIRYHRRSSDQIETGCNQSTVSIYWAPKGLWSDCFLATTCTNGNGHERNDHGASGDPFLAEHDQEDDVSDDEAAARHDPQTLEHDRPRHPV